MADKQKCDQLGKYTHISIEKGMQSNRPAHSSKIIIARVSRERSLHCNCCRIYGRRGKETERGGEKDVLFTASHSFKSSPGGSLTASLRFPLPSVASMSCLN